MQFWAAEYDVAVAASPEASVARYSFGDPQILENCTNEIIEKLVEWRVVSRNYRVLDYGCGIGRIIAPIANLVAEVVGVDISSVMLAEASRRLSGFSNVKLGSPQMDGPINGQFDLVLVVDVLPYVADPMPLLSSLAPRIARGGNLFVMNWDYRHTLRDQQIAASSFAEQESFDLVRNGTSEFTHWDGLIFQFLNPK